MSKLVGQYRATPIALADGQTSLLGTDAKGNLELSATFSGSVTVKPPSVVGDIADITLAAATVTQLVGVPTPCATAIVQAPIGNADLIRVGAADIGVARGLILLAGQSVPIAIDDLSKLYVWSATAGVKVAVVYNAP